MSFALLAIDMDGMYILTANFYSKELKRESLADLARKSQGEQ